MNLKLSQIPLWLTVVFTLSSCSHLYYSFWETFGVEKRDLLADEVAATKDDQEETQQTFRNALEQLKSIYKVETNQDLEKAYQETSQAYEQAEEKADVLRARIAKVDKVANDLFDEWRQEITEISNPNLRRSSQEKLRNTAAKFKAMQSALQKTEKSLKDPLQQFKDVTLFLKHNLNAQAIGGLQSEMESIEREIEELIKTINQSIKASDLFIADFVS